MLSLPQKISNAEIQNHDNNYAPLMIKINVKIMVRIPKTQQ